MSAFASARQAALPKKDLPDWSKLLSRRTEEQLMLLTQYAGDGNLFGFPAVADLVRYVHRQLDRHPEGVCNLPMLPEDFIGGIASKLAILLDRQPDLIALVTREPIDPWLPGNIVAWRTVPRGAMALQDFIYLLFWAARTRP